MLTLFQSLCQFRLGWELAHWAICVKQGEDLALEAVWVRGEWGHRKFLFAHGWIHGVGERVIADQTTVLSSPNDFFILKDPQVVCDLPVAHLKRGHERTEMASWVCGQVPHEATTLIAPVACFVGAANHAQKPQPSPPICFLKDKSATFNTARIEALEMQNLFEVAEATAITANERKESRGAHARDDHPERDDDNWLKHSIYYSETKEVSKRDVNYRPKTVQAFQPMVRSY